MAAYRLSGFRISVAVLVLGGMAIAAALYAGAYNVAADVPHTALVHSMLEYARERSIIAHSRGLAAPADIDDPKRVAAGAVLYKEMCSGCHLAPGMEATEISQGLYPKAPELSHGTGLRAEQAFWVIKHGVKMSGMPAWGPTHSDAMIWDLVAFLRALPSLSAADYQTATKDKEGHDHRMEQMRSPPDAHQGHSHQHD